jgi:hypothetical protein
MIPHCPGESKNTLAVVGAIAHEARTERAFGDLTG